MPNTLATIVFYGWPVIVAALFMRLPLQRALVWSLLAGYLIVPHGMMLNLPLLPTYEKDLATALAALLMCLALQGGQGARSAEWRAAGWLPESPTVRLLLLLFFIQPILTVLTNMQPTTSGARTLPGMSPMDIGAATYTSLTSILPFLLARRYLADESGRETALRALVAAGLGYSLLVAFEIRFSPQLNNMIYGYTQFDWIQQLRDGGFRPVVFLQHGLWTAVFMTIAVVGAAALWRLARGAWLGATAWLVMILALSSSLGAFLLAAVFAPLARFASARLQSMVVASVAVVVLTYPMLRSLDLVPTTIILQTAEAISPARESSLRFRFYNEDILLERANERPLFGWGGWGRGRIYDEESGRGASTTDGRWIIIFGQGGWVGYVAEFGLLTAPLLLAARRCRQGAYSPVAMGLALALSVNLLDMMLNGTLTPVTWLLAGLTLGYAERGAIDRPVAASPSAPRLRPVFGAARPETRASRSSIIR